MTIINLTNKNNCLLEVGLYNGIHSAQNVTVPDTTFFAFSANNTVTIQLLKTQSKNAT